MRIRFNSLLKPDEIGFEFTGDSMTFWESAYRNGGVLNGAFGWYQTLGDNGVQHTPLMACSVSDFTDFCASLTKYIGSHLADFSDFSTHAFGFKECHKDTALFLSTIVYNEEKPKWFNLQDRKVSTSDAKRHDKRWTAVPSWANGSIASAYELFCLATEYRSNYLFERYALQSFFHDTLYSLVPHGNEWDKITEWHSHIPGDHRQAFNALKAVVEGIERINYALRAANSAIYNSTPRTEATSAAA